MNRLRMSSAGAALLRALLTRALVDRDRILLTNYRSTDWQSLTFVGERHEFSFRVAAPDAQTIYERMTAKLDIPSLQFRGRSSPTWWSTGSRRTSRTARSASPSKRLLFRSN
jgi:hypothetical protein